MTKKKGTATRTRRTTGMNPNRINEALRRADAAITKALKQRMPERWEQLGYEESLQDPRPGSIMRDDGQTRTPGTVHARDRG